MGSPIDLIIINYYVYGVTTVCMSIPCELSTYTQLLSLASKRGTNAAICSRLCVSIDRLLTPCWKMITNLVLSLWMVTELCLAPFLEILERFYTSLLLTYQRNTVSEYFKYPSKHIYINCIRFLSVSIFLSLTSGLSKSLLYYMYVEAALSHHEQVLKWGKQF